MKNFEDVTLRLEASHRGGGIEISLDHKGFKGHRMTAYQNYLGGGMLGRIQNDCTVNNWERNDKLVKYAEKLSRYFHDLTNHVDDEWEAASFERNQLRPSSAF